MLVSSEVLVQVPLFYMIASTCFIFASACLQADGLMWGQASIDAHLQILKQ